MRVRSYEEPRTNIPRRGNRPVRPREKPARPVWPRRVRRWLRPSWSVGPAARLNLRVARKVRGRLVHSRPGFVAAAAIGSTVIGLIEAPGPFWAVRVAAQIGICRPFVSAVFKPTGEITGTARLLGGKRGRAAPPVGGLSCCGAHQSGGSTATVTTSPVFLSFNCRNLGAMVSAARSSRRKHST